MEEQESRTLFPGKPMTEPNWLVWSLMKGCRVVVLTVLWSGLGMGAGLFCGIIGVVALSALHNRAPVMSMAYRNVAFPVAICSGACAFLWNAFRVLQAAEKRRRERRTCLP
jgi:hypothetical protein